jgi:hypothetical protein
MPLRMMLVAILAWAPTPASAQDEFGDEALLPQPLKLSPDPQARRSEETALGLSLALTVGGVVSGASAAVGFGIGGKGNDTALALSLTCVGVAALGLVFGPAVGHYYAGDRGAATKGLLVRLLLAGLTAGFSVGALYLPGTIDEHRVADMLALYVAGWVLASLAAVGLVYFAVSDIVDAPRAAREAGGAGDVSVAPLVTRIGNSTAFGLALGTRF